MTDLEKIELCAKAMGVEVHKSLMPVYAGRWWLETGDGPMRAYNPLRDDEQAMALLKRFGLTLQKGSVWYVSETLSLPQFVNESLNRAIVECVAVVSQKAAGSPN